MIALLGILVALNVFLGVFHCMEGKSLTAGFSFCTAALCFCSYLKVLLT